MSLEDDLFAQRLRRTAEIEALGFRAYGQRFDFTHTIPQILADVRARRPRKNWRRKAAVQIAGRIQTIRRMGKAGFMHLMQSGERLQVYVRKDAVQRARVRALSSCSTWATSWAWTAICSARAPAS